MKEKPNKSKKIIILIIVLLIVAVSVFFIIRKIRSNRNINNAKEEFSYVRTVTLSKSSLMDTIVASGSIESQTTSTISSSVNGATISKINYSIGDYVEEGDVIIELDTTNLNKQISKQSEKVDEQKDQLQDKYDSAVDDYNEAASAYETAKESVNSAYAALSQAEYKIRNIQDKYDQAKDNYDKEMAKHLADPDYVVDQQYLTALDEAEKDLKTAKEAVEYDKLEKAYNEAVENKTKAKSTKQQAETALDNAAESLDKGVDTESLDDLYDTAGDYQLKAKSSGQITNISALLGSSASGTLATIQDTGKLKIALTIDEYDILKLKLGMKAIIETDASDNTYEGEVSQISPVASTGMGSSGGFEIEVVVTSEDVTGLLIGMNAEVTIVVTETSENYNVPIDAVETKLDGTKVIYVENNSGEYEELVVTTGETNGYYVEIISDQLRDGMKVRASANEDEASVEITENENIDFGGFTGGDFDMSNFPGGGNMPQGGNGGFSGAPSGGFPGGR